MMRPIPNRMPRGRRALVASLLVAGGAAGAAGGCKGVLDVENPNNVIEANITTVAAATPLANGVVGITVRALNAVLDPFSTVSDELDFVGSQDGFFQLDVGNVSNPAIQFSNNGFARVAEARWMGDEALERFAGWEADGTLATPNLADRATAYLYTAITYATIGDMFDDFALSDRVAPAAPIGEQNMRVVYDTAVVYLDRGLTAAHRAAPYSPDRPNSQLETLKRTTTCFPLNLKVWVCERSVSTTPRGPASSFATFARLQSCLMATSLSRLSVSGGYLPKRSTSSAANESSSSCVSRSASRRYIERRRSRSPM